MHPLFGELRRDSWGLAEGPGDRFSPTSPRTAGDHSARNRYSLRLGAERLHDQATAPASASAGWQARLQPASARGVGLRVLTGQGAQIDTTTAAGRLVFGIFAALAEFERELIRERTLAGLTGARTPRRQEVRAVESSGAAGPGRDGAPRQLRVRTLPRTRDYPRDALPVRRAAGPVARAGPEGPRHLTPSAWTSTRAIHLPRGVFRPLP